MSKRAKYLWVAGFFLFSLLIRLALLDYTYVRVIEADGVSYVNGAKGFLDGFDISRINIIDQPLFSILIAFFSWFAQDWETAGRMVSIVAGSFLGPIVFLISNERGNSNKVSFFSALFISITPIFVISSYQVFSDTLNCTFLLLGVWQLLIALRARKNIFFFLSGLSFSLAYLTRLDSIVPSFFVFLFVLYYTIRVNLSKKRWLNFTAFAAGLAILSLPYIFFLHAQLGRWVFSGRQVLAPVNLAAYTGGNYEDANYGLTRNLELRGEVSNLINIEGPKKGIITLWIEDPTKMLSSFLGNLKIEWDVFVEYVPWYVAALALVTIIVQHRKFVYDNLPFFAFSSPLFFLYPFFWPDSRHLFHFFIPIWLWAVEGIELLSGTLQKAPIWKRSFRNLQYSEIFKYLIYGAVLIAIISSFKPKVVTPTHLNYLRQKEMGVWISKNTPKEAIIMARWGRLTFYTDRKTVMFPYAEWDDIKKYMKKNGVTHLVVDESFMGIRPQVRQLLLPLFSGSSASPDNSLSIIRLKVDQFGGMIVYKVKDN